MKQLCQRADVNGKLAEAQAQALARSEGLLAGWSPYAGGESQRGAYEQLRMAMPERLFVDFEAFFADLEDTVKVAAFKEGLNSSRTEDGNLNTNNPVPYGLQAYAPTELAQNIFRLISGKARPGENFHMSNYLKGLRRALDIESYKQAILPLVRLINKAFAARHGVKNNDRGMLKNVETTLGLREYDEPQGERTLVRHLNDLIRENDKNEPVKERLLAIRQRIDALRANDQDIGAIFFCLPNIVDRAAQMSRPYDLEQQIDLIEDQVAYLEKYVPTKVEKEREVARKAAEERAGEEREAAEQLREMEVETAGISAKIGTLEGSVEDVGSIRAARQMAEYASGKLGQIKLALRDGLERVKSVKLGILKKNAKYILEVVGQLNEILDDIRGGAGK